MKNSKTTTFIAIAICLFCGLIYFQYFFPKGCYVSSYNIEIQAQVRFLTANILNIVHDNPSPFFPPNTQALLMEHLQKHGQLNMIEIKESTELITFYPDIQTQEKFNGAHAIAFVWIDAREIGIIGFADGHTEIFDDSIEFQKIKLSGKKT
jgi:hypothetical protein